MKKMTIAQAKQIDLVDYLGRLGHQPKRTRNNDYWYKSPFRNERTPSFVINRRKNVWYDFGEGAGGDLVNFGTRYFNCSISQLLERLSWNNASFSEHIPARPVVEKKKEKIQVIAERPISSEPLLNYLKQRKIPVAVARQFCVEVDFLLYNKKYTAIGFKNDAGGFELRNEYFKGSSSPKTVTFINNNRPRLAVFEGFFNFLSFQAIQQRKSKAIIKRPYNRVNFLVLNSLAFFERSREQMGQHQQVHLYLDRDNAGSKWTDKALGWSSIYRDKSVAYKQFKDFNEYLTHKAGQG